MTPETTKIFVLDTSVILYDSDALKAFEEHDVAVPITVLEELDQFKKGSGVINLQARGFLRELDRMSQTADVREWVPINGAARGRLRVVAADTPRPDATRVFGSSKNDHQILNSAIAIAQQEPQRRVILVSKDINLRVKARGLGLEAEDYESVRVEDPDRLYSGKIEMEVSKEVVDRLHNDEALGVDEVVDEAVPANQYFILRSGSNSVLARHNARTGRIEKLPPVSAYGIRPRNAEQTFTLHAILDPKVPLVTVTGPAGTGKTLLALAGALEQRRNYRQIYLTRPIVPLSNRDIGYLPGDIASKIGPYMQPLWDNLSFIKSHFQASQAEYRHLESMVESDKLHILPLAYIRGRSLSNIIFIVDEAQNLTPHEVKTVITRAGEGTKVIFTGDIFQIDTPYLDAASNGLSYLVERIADHPLHAHVNLDKGERSALANLASSLL